MICSPLVHSRETARHENGRDAGDSSRLAPDTSWQLWRKHKSRGSASVSKRTSRLPPPPAFSTPTSGVLQASLCFRIGVGHGVVKNITLGCMHTQCVKSVLLLHAHTVCQINTPLSEKGSGEDSSSSSLSIGIGVLLLGWDVMFFFGDLH